MELVLAPRTDQRLLSRTEQLLANYLDNERQALALAPHVYIPEGLSPSEEEQHIEGAVISILAEALDRGDYCEYVSGIRRDTLRG